MRFCHFKVIIALAILVGGCRQAPARLQRLIADLPNQTGDTRGYPSWGNWIIREYPASDLIDLGAPAVNELIKHLDDNTPVKCRHYGRSDKMPYTVGDVVIYILARIDDPRAQQIVHDGAERFKRDSSRGRVAYCWAYLPDPAQPRTPN